MNSYNQTWLDETVATMNARSDVEVAGKHIRPPKTEGWVDLSWFASVLEGTQGSEWAALHAHLTTHRERWLELPMFAELVWEGHFTEERVGVCGGFALRSLADAWDVREEQSLPLEDPERQLIIDIDNWHGNGDYSFVSVETNRLEVVYFDGKRSLPLTLDPLEYFEVAFECVGWPGWQILYVADPKMLNDASYYEAAYFTPLEKYLKSWFPDRPRPHLDAGLERWRA